MKKKKKSLAAREREEGGKKVQKMQEIFQSGSTLGDKSHCLIPANIEKYGSGASEAHHELVLTFPS